MKQGDFPWIHPTLAESAIAAGGKGGLLLVPVADLNLDPTNVRRHPEKNHAATRASLRRFGQRLPIVVQRDGMIVRAGNDRLAVFREEGWSHIVALVVDEGNVDATAYAIADNRTAELAEWDDEELAKVLRSLTADGFDIGELAFDDADLAELGWEDESDEIEDPGAQELPMVPVSKRGDLWLLGEHRLLCGDSTDASDVARVMNGERADLMNTDPPYGVAYQNDDRPNPGVAKPRVAKPRVAQDELTDDQLQDFLERAFGHAVSCALLPNAAWYMWHANLTQGYFAAAAAAANVVLHRQIIWVKPVLLLTQGQYHWKHEPCFMGWVKGQQPPDYGRGSGERDQTTVWEIDGVGVLERRELNHSTPKPVGLFEIPITKHLKPTEICYEPFSGSGPQYIAAQKLGRRCFGLELMPPFVDTIVCRWQKATGKQAILDGDGRTFAEIAEARGVPLAG